MKKLLGFTGLLLALCAAALFGCGNNSGGGETGKLTLEISDAPIDGATHVWIKFNAVEVKPVKGRSINFNLSSMARIDMLALTGGVTSTLLNEINLPVGDYEWMRLKVNTAPEDLSGGPFSQEDFCYIVIGQNAFPLVIPSADMTGLKINHPFTVGPGGSSNFVLDFDLRKSITVAESGDKYILRPTLRIVELEASGDIAGNITNLGAKVCSDATVYVFEGTGVVPDDVDSIGVEPIASAKAVEVAGVCGYTVPFLPEGAYTVALTLDAALDNATTDDNAIMTFDPKADAIVVADSVTTVNFVVPEPEFDFGDIVIVMLP